MSREIEEGEGVMGDSVYEDGRVGEGGGGGGAVIIQVWRLLKHQ